MQTLRVGEVAKRAGVNLQTIYYYERRGLLPAALCRARPPAPPRGPRSGVEGAVPPNLEESLPAKSGGNP
jgi:hypothetical protein